MSDVLKSSSGQVLMRAKALHEACSANDPNLEVIGNLMDEFGSALELFGMAFIMEAKAAQISRGKPS